MIKEKNTKENNIQFKRKLSKQSNMSNFIHLLEEFKLSEEYKNVKLGIKNLKENKLSSTNDDEVYLVKETMERLESSGDLLIGELRYETIEKIEKTASPYVDKRSSCEDIVNMIDVYVELQQKNLILGDDSDEESPFKERISEIIKFQQNTPKKGIIKQSSFEVSSDSSEVEDEYSRKLRIHNKKIDIVMMMEEEELENLQVFVHLLNLRNQRENISEEVKKKLQEVNQKFFNEDINEEIKPKGKEKRRVSFNQEMPKYRESIENKKVEVWWEKNFKDKKSVNSNIVKNKMILYLTTEMAKDNIVANFLYETYIENELQTEDSDKISLEELKEATHLQTINDFFEEKGNKITKYHVVCSSDQYDIRNVFSEKQPEGFNALDGDNMTPLHYACSCGLSLESIKFLLEHKSDPNISNKESETALHFSLKNGASIETVELLLKNGANPNLRDQRNMNSLHIVLSMGNFDLDLIGLLLKYNTVYGTRDDNGLLPLDYAKESEEFKSIKKMLK